MGIKGGIAMDFERMRIKEIELVIEYRPDQTRWVAKNRKTHIIGIHFSGKELHERTCAAIALYADRTKWKKLVAKVMRTDFSWGASADKYLEMYAEL